MFISRHGRASRDPEATLSRQVCEAVMFAYAGLRSVDQGLGLRWLLIINTG
jgi:hypothetical protein